METPVICARRTQITQRNGGLILKQPTVDWKALAKYHELCNTQKRLKHIFLTNVYNIHESKEVPIIMNWLGHEGLIFAQTLNDEEQ